MKKIFYIAFAAVFAGFAISCQKEESVSEKTDAVQYTFNITVKDQVGFDSDASTKGGSSEKYKSGWENKDKIFLFFKPTGESLLEDRYATLTYNGSSWDGTVSSGSSSLGEEGTLSAVYVYNLGDVTPEFSTDKWTIATGNTFYNCQTVSYTVSGNEISAALSLAAPADFVRFYVTNATGALTCDKVKGWKDIAIGGNLAVSNVTCTGYMDGVANTGDNNVMEYYGRIINAGTSLENVDCEFSVVKNGKVYERTATPSTAARSFKMTVATDKWTEAPGKLPGLFSVADDVQVRFSQGNLVATIDATGAPTAWKFATNQYDYLGEDGANKTIGVSAGDVDFFGWSTASTTYGINTSKSFKSYSGDFVDWGKAYCEKNSITPDNTWRTLSKDEWTYLFNTRTVNGGTGAGKSYSLNITYGGKIGMVLYPDDYTGSVLSGTVDSLPEGVVFLPAAGFRNGSSVGSAGLSGFYWSSTELDNIRDVYNVYFLSNVNPDEESDRHYGFSVRLITDVE